MNLPHISIIVCCHNSVLRLPDTLSALAVLKTDVGCTFEVVLVDNNSTDGTAVFAKSFWKELNSDIIFKLVKEDRSGLSHARLKGISESVGDIIVFCDDDNLLHNDYLQIAISIMKSNSNIGIVGGLGILKTDSEIPVWFNKVENAYAVGAQYDNDGEVAKPCEYIWGAGMVIRRAIFERLIKVGFKSVLSGRKGGKLTSGEDTEVCIVTKQLGYLLYYDSRLKYFHCIPKSRLKWDYLIKLLRGFSSSHVYFEIYHGCFDKGTPANGLSWGKQFRDNAKDFFRGASTLNWYKTMYLAFIENREGYISGLVKRQYLYRMIELVKIKLTYNSYLKKIDSLKAALHHFNTKLFL